MKQLQSMFIAFIFSLIFVYTKRKIQVLFWPLYILLTIIISIIVCYGFSFIIVGLLDIKGLDSVDFGRGVILLFVLLCPLVWKAIKIFEANLEGSVLKLSIVNMFIGYIYGIIVNFFLIDFIFN